MSRTSLLHPSEIVGVAEIADRAGVKPVTVHAWRARHPDFPSPVASLSMGPVWDWRQVEAWLSVPRPNGRHSR